MWWFQLSTSQSQGWTQYKNVWDNSALSAGTVHTLAGNLLWWSINVSTTYVGCTVLLECVVLSVRHSMPLRQTQAGALSAAILSTLCTWPLCRVQCPYSYRLVKSLLKDVSMDSLCWVRLALLSVKTNWKSWLLAYLVSACLPAGQTTSMMLKPWKFLGTWNP